MISNQTLTENTAPETWLLFEPIEDLGIAHVIGGWKVRILLSWKQREDGFHLEEDERGNRG